MTLMRCFRQYTPIMRTRSLSSFMVVVIKKCELSVYRGYTAELIGESLTSVLDNLSMHNIRNRVDKQNCKQPHLTLKHKILITHLHLISPFIIRVPNGFIVSLRDI